MKKEKDYTVAVTNTVSWYIIEMTYTQIDARGGFYKLSSIKHYEEHFARYSLWVKRRPTRARAECATSMETRLPLAEEKEDPSGCRPRSSST